VKIATDRQSRDGCSGRFAWHSAPPLPDACERGRQRRFDMCRRRTEQPTRYERLGGRQNRRRDQGRQRRSNGDPRRRHSGGSPTCRLDIVVVNAGILRMGHLQAVSLQELDLMLKRPTCGAFSWPYRPAAAHLSEGGRIITVGSNTAVRSGYPGSSVYAMTKAAVAVMVKGIAIDLAPPRHHGEQHPAMGPTLTDMTASHIDSITPAIPLKRVGDPDEIAGLVAYLASGESGYMTGSSPGRSTVGWPFETPRKFASGRLTPHPNAPRSGCRSYVWRPAHHRVPSLCSQHRRARAAGRADQGDGEDFQPFILRGSPKTASTSG